LSINKNVDVSTLTDLTGFSVSANGEALLINSIQVDPTNASRLLITVEQEIFDNDIITLDYDADVVLSTDETVLEKVTALAVKNKLPFHFSIPTKIEAEDFSVNQGLALETTTDVGGGLNIGYTNTGDYVAYRIRVLEDGDYPVEVRIACNNAAGIMELEQRTTSGEILNSVFLDVPVTGGWQTWRTISTKIKLTAGNGILRVKIIQPEFNINWFQFLNATIISSLEDNSKTLISYPNPTDQYLTIEFPEKKQFTDSAVVIRSVNGTIIRTIKPVRVEDHFIIRIADLPAGVYFVSLENNGEIWRSKFIKM